MDGNNSGKIKRMRNNSRVELAPATHSGRILGPSFTAKHASCRQKSGDRPKRLSTTAMAGENGSLSFSGR